MRIVCPGCKTQYDVPEAMLAGGTRTVRCARCASEWTPPANAAAPPARDDFDAAFAHDMDGQYGEAKDRARPADDVADDGVDFSMTGMRARMTHEPGPRPALAAPGGRRRGAAVVAVAAWRSLRGCDVAHRGHGRLAAERTRLRRRRVALRRVQSRSISDVFRVSDIST
jgi:predicted Zn finger-like uncharacterized protein